jgi:hypothetical protein
MIARDRAESFLRLTLGHIGRQYPYALQHVTAAPGDVAASPSGQHPIFHGSFDWHSCVHGWWQVLTLARLFPDLPQAAEVRSRADDMLTLDKVAGEMAYFARPTARGFERPYGWAWLLALHREAARHEGRRWGEALEPLARLIAVRFAEHLPQLTYPIRTGTHGNTAFACALALEWARAFDPPLARLIEARALYWFGGDRGCQAWEPGGDEFLSPALTEALLMRRVLDDGFAGWFAAFLPDAAAGRPETLFVPATVSNRADGKIAHLDGLNLSRAWCWREIAGGAPAVREVALAAAERHLAASLPHIADDYMGSHWLATFALLAEGAATPAPVA